jgi:hypothetical protein
MVCIPAMAFGTFAMASTWMSCSDDGRQYIKGAIFTGRLFTAGAKRDPARAKRRWWWLG